VIAGTGLWLPIEAIGTVTAVTISITVSIVALSRDRSMKKYAEDAKLDSVVLAVVGRPASRDGTFAHIPGLVDQVKDLSDKFSEHSREVRLYQQKSDSDIIAISNRLDYVATQYVTNGGSTVKDDLVIIRRELANLRITVNGILEGQNQMNDHNG